MAPIRPKYVMHIKIKWNKHTKTTITEDPRPLESATVSG